MKLAQQLFAPYLEEGEEIIAVCHRHPFVVIPTVLKYIGIGIIIPAGLWYLFSEFWLLFLIWMVVTIWRIGHAFMVWYHDTILVTSLSIVDVYWNNMFDKSSTRLEYEMIEGVSQEIKGFIRTIFNYGDVAVQIMSGGKAIMLKDAINPKKAERLILDAQEKFTGDQNLKDAESLKSLLINLVRQQASNNKKK